MNTAIFIARRTRNNYLQYAFQLTKETKSEIVKKLKMNYTIRKKMISELYG